MEFDKMNEFSNDNFEDSSDITAILETYMNHYKWFIISVLIIGFLSFLYVRLQVPKFYISSTILIKDSEKGKSITELSDFEGLGLYANGENLLENEIQILQSRSLITKVVDELKLNTKYSIVDTPYDKEQYPNSPILLKYSDNSEGINKISTDFEVTIQSKEKFKFQDYDGKTTEHAFGEEFAANLGNDRSKNEKLIRIELNEEFPKELIGEKILVEVAPLNSVVSGYIDKITIESVNDKSSNVLLISLNENIKNKGISFLSNLIEQYNADKIEDKNEVAQGTIKFLDERLDLIAGELMVIEDAAAQFRAQNRMLNEKAGTEYYLQSSSNNETESVAIKTQMQLVNYTIDELSKEANYDLLPINIGIDDIGIVQLISEYNTLILKRNRVLTSSSIKNPIVVDIDSQLMNLKNNLNSSLVNARSSLQIKIDALSAQSGRISSEIASVPINEQEYNEIIRKQKTKNELYLFLLQKREESILSNAVGVDKAKIINRAYSNEAPVSPKKGIIYFGALLLGLLAPAVVIYMRDIFDTKLHSEKDLKRTHIPYIGEVPLTKLKRELIIKDGDNSAIAEAFRYIRTNINFMLDAKEKGKTIFVTSTLSGEGKTLTSINLATSLAMSGRKTLLLGMDLRVSKITQELDLEEILGVTNYIKNEELKLDSITETYTNVNNLDVINSGDTPPNPVELLMSDRVEELFGLVKEKYDFIVVDTAPVGLVTDTIQIGKYADLTIYVARANYLDKRMLHIPAGLHYSKKLPNMAMLINGHEKISGNYGYGYGYGEVKKKSFISKLISS